MLYIMGGISWVFLTATVSCGDTFTATTGGGANTNVGRPCEMQEDCGAPSSQCSYVTCQAKKCVETPIDGALDASQQTAGDCYTLRCHNGVLENSIDDNDVPQDGNECTEGNCDNGVPSTSNAPEGTPCGDGDTLYCNNAGMCAGCSTPTDCGTPTFCLSYNCRMDMTCQVLQQPAGTVLPTQIPGDCLKRVCNSEGTPMDMHDDADVPPTVPLSCETPYCANGMVMSTQLQTGSPCTQSTTRFCCNGACCQLGDLCTNNNCTLGGGGAGGN